MALRPLAVARRGAVVLWLSLACLAAAAAGIAGPERTSLVHGRQLQSQRRVLSTFDNLLSKYYSNEELEDYLKTYSLRCKRIARLFSIGRSVEGRELWALEISDKPGEEEAEPNFKFIGNVHGDEPSGRQLTLALAEWLCEHYGTDKRARDLVNHVHLYLLPTMNPDGFAARSRNNKNNRDLNRNFPDPIRSSSMDGDGSEEPEARAVMNWTLTTGFTASATMHEGAVLANYPWDGTRDGTTRYNGTADDATFRFLAGQYASLHGSMSQSKEFQQGITNGAAWYPVYGGMQDWNYIVGRCMELTLELSEHKWPPASTLHALWRDNFEALTRYPLIATLGGLRGVVRDRTSGQPLAATVFVAGLPNNYTARPGRGDFYRPLAPGKYRVVISHEGYTAHEEEVEVADDGAGVALAPTHLSPAAATGAAAAPPPP